MSQVYVYIKMGGMRAREQGAAPAEWQISECHRECSDYE